MPPYLPGPGRPIPDQILEEQRLAELDRASRTVEDPDEMRDDARSTGRGSWLVALLLVLGIVGLVVLLGWLAGAL